jgi:hypothetical protein
MDPSLPCNQRNGCMMQSSLGGSDTGETEQGVFRITQSQDKANKIDGERKTFFATPFFWKYVMDGEIRGANETKYVDIFTCSKMLIPVNIKLKHWVRACIDFDHQQISWYESLGETHEERSCILFTWLKREHPFNRTTKFEPEKRSIDSGLPPHTWIPLAPFSLAYCARFARTGPSPIPFSLRGLGPEGLRNPIPPSVAHPLGLFLFVLN